MRLFDYFLGRFAWYRRARAGYWGETTSLIFGKVWFRSRNELAPTPNGSWVFYPWGSKEMSNGYIDEWYDVDGVTSMPYSQLIYQAFGTRDVKLLKARFQSLLNEARIADEGRDTWLNECYNRDAAIAKLRRRLSDQGRILANRPVKLP